MHPKDISTGLLSLLGLMQGPSFIQSPFSSKPSLTGEHWRAFNATVSGRLHRSTKTRGPCYQPSSNEITSNSTTIETQHLSSWEACQTLAKKGNNGFYLEVRGHEDVSSALEFAGSRGVRLVVDRLDTEFCRSPLQDSLALWMEHMNNIDYSPKFTPFSCNSLSEAVPAITYEAGVHPEQLYSFADNHGVTVLGEDLTNSVGSPFGTLAPAMGSPLDSVLEFQAVTPDGVYRKVNRCHNTDLWYAMRGGGSTSFAVVISVTVRAYPKITLQTFSASFKPNSSTSKEILRIFAENALKWAAEGWGGYVNENEVVLANPSLATSQASKSLSLLTEYFRSLGSELIHLESVHNTSFREHRSRTRRNTIPISDHQTALASRLIPEPVFSSASGREDLIKAILTGSNVVEKWGVHLASPYGLDRDRQGPSSIHPASYQSPWLVVFQNMVNDDMSFSERLVKYSEVGKAGNYIRYITPHSGTYHAHGDLSEPKHQNAFWGEHQHQLLLIKERYDPLRILSSWQSIGWNGREDPKYSCYTPARLQIVPCDKRCR